MGYDDLLNHIEEEAGSGVSAPGSEGTTTEDNVAYLPSQLGVVKPARKRKKKKAQMEEGAYDLPDVQQQLLDDNEAATSEKDLWVNSTIEEEPFIKFWLLSDGTFVPMPDGHLTGLTMGDYGELKDTGAIRISSDPRREMALDYEGTPNSDQVIALQGLAKLHNTARVVIEDESNTESDLDKRGDVIDLKSPRDLSRILRGQGRQQSLAAQFHESLEEAMDEDMTKLREDLKPSLTRLFEGDPFHFVERDALLWKSRFGVDRYLTAGAPLVSVEKKVRDLQKLAGTLLQKYGNDRGYLEMLIEAMAEREPLNSFDGFKANDYLYGTRMHSSHEGVEMVFEAALDPLYNVSETIYVGDTDVLDRWEELARGIKRVGNVVYPKGERFTPGLLQLLEHAIIDSTDVDVDDEVEDELRRKRNDT